MFTHVIENHVKFHISHFCEKGKFFSSYVDIVKKLLFQKKISNLKNLASLGFGSPRNINTKKNFHKVLYQVDKKLNKIK